MGYLINAVLQDLVVVEYLKGIHQYSEYF